MCVRVHPIEFEHLATNFNDLSVPFTVSRLPEPRIGFSSNCCHTIRTAGWQGLLRTSSGWSTRRVPLLRLRRSTRGQGSIYLSILILS